MVILLKEFKHLYQSVSLMTPGFPRENLSEVHGNIFTERCMNCGREYLRGSPTKTIGLKKTGRICTTLKSNSRPCRWETFCLSIYVYYKFLFRFSGLNVIGYLKFGAAFCFNWSIYFILASVLVLFLVSFHWFILCMIQ